MFAVVKLVEEWCHKNRVFNTRYRHRIRRWSSHSPSKADDAPSRCTTPIRGTEHVKGDLLDLYLATPTIARSSLVESRQGWICNSSPPRSAKMSRIMLVVSEHSSLIILLSDYRLLTTILTANTTTTPTTTTTTTPTTSANPNTTDHVWPAAAQLC